MLQFLLADARPDVEVELAGADYHYLVRVRRMAAGGALTVVDGAGTRYRATVTRVTDRTLSLRIGQRQAAPAARLPACRLTLIQALPKGALMDRIVRQATELGVAAIVPVIAAHTQGRPEPAAAARRQARWQRIARQAVQQSGAVAPPSIDPPLELRQYLDQRPPAALELVFHPGAVPLQEMPVSDLPLQRRLEVRCAVGPEGGFSAAERELFQARGFRGVALQAGVLRVDTAAVAALAAVGQLLATVHPCSTNVIGSS